MPKSWIYLLCLFTFYAVSEAATTTDCTSDANCTATAETCDTGGGKCQCASGYYEETTECKERKSNGADCSSSPDNCLTSAGLSCQGSNCACSSTKYWDSSACVDRKSNGADCSSSPDNCLTSAGLSCQGSNCACSSTKYWDSSACEDRKSNGADCSSSPDNCLTSAGLSCQGSNCACSSTKYWDSSACEDRKSNGADCSSIPDSCLTSAGLSCLSDKCACSSTKYWDSSACEDRKSNGADCSSSPDNCLTSAGLSCQGSNCACSSTKYWDSSACEDRKSNGADCSSSPDNCLTSAGLSCQGSNCACSSAKYWDSSACEDRKSNGADCSSSPDNCLTSAGLSCQESNCACSSTKYWNSTACVDRKSNGADCSSSPDNCLTSAGLSCQGSNCACSSTKYWESSSCADRKSNGIACTASPENCLTSLGLSCQSGSCACSSTKYWDSSSCADKKDVGAECTDNAQCGVSNSECTGNKKCTCKKKDLGGDCTNNEQCGVSNSECSGNKTCTCKSIYYQHNTTSCLLKKDLDANCTADVQCGVPNSNCTESKCTCTNSYYKGNATSCLSKKDLGVACTNTIQCSVANSECLGADGNKTCTCTSDYYKDTTKSCLLKKGLGGDCTNNVQCGVSNSECSGNKTCTCKSTYYQHNATSCLLKKDLDANCTADVQCGVPNSNCTESKCTCTNSYYKGNATSCLSKKDLGVACTNTIQCSVANSECLGADGNKTCTCTSDYYKDTTKSCLLKKGLGGDCTNNVQCGVSNSECSGNKTCTCKSTYYQHNVTSCLLKKDLDANCTADVQCGVPNSNCTESKCACTNSYYKGNATSCLSKKDLGVACSSTTECGVTNSACLDKDGSKTCTCTSTYYQDTTTSCVKKKDLGVICTKTEQCGVTNSACLDKEGSKTCTCTSTYYQETAKSCLLKKDLGVTCTKTEQCGVTNSACLDKDGSKTCTCTSTYYQETAKSCLLKKDLGVICTKTEQCGVTNSACLDKEGSKTCTCTSTYYQETAKLCQLKKDLGVTCLNTIQCGVTNSECLDKDGSKTCTCTSTYYPMAAKSCLLKKNIGGVCSADGQCGVDSSECSGGKCACKSTHYNESATSCKPRKALGESCVNKAECSVANSDCIGSGDKNCTCISTYYQQSTSSCLERKSYDVSCSKDPENCLTIKGLNCRTTDSGDKCRCSAEKYWKTLDRCQDRHTYNQTCQVTPNSCGTDLTCSSGKKCRCTDSTKYWNNANTACQTKIDLSVTCSTSDTTPCKDTNAECINNDAGTGTVCRCKDTYVDDNGFSNSGGTCKSMSELKTTLSTENVKTTDITVKWTEPALSSQINSFEVSWKRTAGGAAGTGSPKDVGKVYTRVISGLIPGAEYTFTVKSKEKGSRNSEQTVTSDDHKDRTFPAMPGNLTSSVYVAPDITITWTASTGVVHTYSIKVTRASDNNSELGSKVVNSATLTATISSAVAGTRYNVEIIAISDSSNQRQSEPRQTVIRTTTTKPNPPTALVCDPMDKELTLTWTAPSLPNGDIQYYIVTYSIKGNGTSATMNTTDSTPSKRVNNLNPGTDYELEVQTVNDKFTSVYSTKKDCRTKDALPEKPTDYKSTGKSSNNITLSWGLPTVPNGEIFAYRLTVANGTKCSQEILFTCSSGCTNTSPATFKTKHTEFNGTCDSKIEVEKPIAELHQLILYKVIGLSPYVNYSLAMAAINNAGDGYKSELNIKTDETAPSAILNASAMVLSATTVKVSWEINGPRPGVTTYTIQVFDRYGTRNKLNKTETVTGFYERSYVVTGLQEYWSYSFSVQAQTSIASTTFVPTTTVRTQMAAPGVVDAFTVQRPSGPDFTKVTVSWQLPKLEDRNGDLTLYRLEQNVTVSNRTVNITVPQDPGTIEKIFSVMPETYYFFKVIAINSEGTEGSPQMTNYYAPPGPPPADVLQNTVPVSLNQNIPITQNTVSLYMNKSSFLNEANGPLVERGILIAPGSSYKQEQDVRKNLKEKDYIDFLTYTESKSSGFTKTYRATAEEDFKVTLGVQNKRRRRDTVPNDVFIFILGQQGSCKDGKFCNGPLQANTQYRVIGFVCTRGGCTETAAYGPYKTLAIPPVEEFPLVAVIVPVVVVLLLVIIIIGLLVYKKKRSRSDMYKETEDVETVTKPDIPTKRPITLEDFEKQCNDLHKDSNLKFAREYEELKELSPRHATNAANLDGNKMKNRYVNILPFDHTRVKLNMIDQDDPSTDYINANYLPGYNSPREYIGCQGPIPGTIDDFWRMVWEQSVGIVVMLTLPKEEGRVKCEVYFPTERNETKQYGDIIVETISSSTVNTYDFRIFKLTQGDETRNLKHFHFLNWKDFSANVQNDVMIDFIQNVRSHIQPPDRAGPMIVHCSAGVGRTGTYVALDHLIQFIEQNDFSTQIDIFDLVLNLRQHRLFMVQTEQQYVFIHDCVKDILEKKRVRLAQDGEENLYGNDMYVNKAFEDDENMYQNVNLGGTVKTEL